MCLVCPLSFFYLIPLRSAIIFPRLLPLVCSSFLISDDVSSCHLSCLVPISPFFPVIHRYLIFLIHIKACV